MTNCELRMANGRRVVPGEGASVVAWLLLMMGIGTFAPAVLLPEWRAYQAARVAVQAEQHRLDALGRVVDRERRMLEAIQTDPGVVTRIALREYGARPRGEEVVRVDVPLAASGDEPFVPAAVPPPSAVARAAHYLPALDYDAVFCEGQTRTIVIAMSIGLMAFAVWMPGGRDKGTEGRGGEGGQRRFVGE